MTRLSLLCLYASVIGSPLAAQSTTPTPVSAAPATATATADDLDTKAEIEPSVADKELDLGRRATTAHDPAGALTHYLLALASRPSDTEALIGAGTASLAIEDPDAALNFFARAEENAPRDGRIKAGLGSSLVRLREARAALRMFDEAVRLGVPVIEIASDRGLAWDLRGDSRRAQSDYELVLAARTDAETSRRLALSIAIAGDPLAALATLDPLLRTGDKSAWRARAFVLAISGDLSGAEETARAALLPAQADALKPFFARIGKLKPTQQVAAVNFGYFPSDGHQYSETELLAAAGSKAPPPPPAPAPAPASTAAAAATPAPAPKPLPGKIAPALATPATGPVAGPATAANDATIARVRAEAAARIEARKLAEKQKLEAAKATAAKRLPERYWVQVATGAYKPDLDKEWARLKGKYGSLLSSQSPWSSAYGRTNRLLVGPFKSAADAQAFVNKAAAAGLGTSRFTSEAGQDVERVK